MRHGFNDGGRLLGQVVQRRPPAEPAKDAVYHGFYRHGSQTVFSYAQGGRDFLATAWSGPQPASQLAHLTKGGPAQWPTWIETVGTVGAGRPFATDTIAVPFANPYGALMFLSGLDFLPDGTAAVATMTGEVWIVRGLDAELRQVRWKRFATGLHQPLGVKVIGGRIHVLGRDQVTRLHDLNGDDEADFYECVTNGYATSQGGHDYVIGLEADAQGRFYTSSGNQGMLRLAGTKGVEVLATGLRNPNGTGFSPDDRFFTSSLQEGNWTPASAIVQVELGKDEGAHFGYGGPKAGQAPKPPLLYLPRGEDNSSAGQVFLSDGAWPALRGAGNFVHLSFGAGSALMVTRQQVGGQWQGAAQRIASDFPLRGAAGSLQPQGRAPLCHRHRRLADLHHRRWLPPAAPPRGRRAGARRARGPRQRSLAALRRGLGCPDRRRSWRPFRPSLELPLRRRLRFARVLGRASRRRGSRRPGGPFRARPRGWPRGLRRDHRS